MSFFVMRCFLTCFVALALAATVTSLVVPNGHGSGLETHHSRRSPGEHQAIDKAVTAKCALESCGSLDIYQHFATVSAYSSASSFVSTGGVFPNLGSQFTVISNWQIGASAIAVLANSISVFALYLQSAQVTVQIIVNSFFNFASSFIIIVNQCQNFGQWGAFSIQSEFGSFYAQLLQSIQGFLFYISRAFGIQILIQQAASIWQQFSTSLALFVQFGSQINILSSISNYGVDLRQFAQTFQIHSISAFVGFSASSFSIGTQWSGLINNCCGPFDPSSPFPPGPYPPGPYPPGPYPPGHQPNPGPPGRTFPPAVPPTHIPTHIPTQEPPVTIPPGGHDIPPPQKNGEGAFQVLGSDGIQQGLGGLSGDGEGKRQNLDSFGTQQSVGGANTNSLEKLQNLGSNGIAQAIHR